MVVYVAYMMRTAENQMHKAMKNGMVAWFIWGFVGL